jgi:hypothetical protein
MSPEGVTVGLGWLDGTAATPEPEEVREVIGSRFGKAFDLAGVGFYGRRVGYDGGRASVAWDGRADAAGTTRAEVTQTGLDGLGLVGGVSLLRSLADVGYRPSRVDEWIDDPGRRMTPERVRAAVLAGQVVTHARPGRAWTDDLTGRRTYYLGRVTSDRMVRCYDRPDGECRYELQSRRGAARHASTVLLVAGDPVAAVVGNVVSFADYRESHGRDHRSGARVARLPWWSAVVGDLPKAEAAPIRPRPSLEELEAYFRAFWSERLAELYLALGRGWLMDVIREGAERMSDREVVA